MRSPLKTAIVTVPSQGIGAGIVKAFVARGFNVVANSRKMTQSTEVAASNQVALVDGHIGELWHRLFAGQRPSLADSVRGRGPPRDAHRQSRPKGLYGACFGSVAFRRVSG